MGNRVFACDDCQAICPWNIYAQPTDEVDFLPRHGLAYAVLARLFSWREEEFLCYTEGSAIRRIGYESWQRNLSVALGIVPSDPDIIELLRQRPAHATPLVAEHIDWALAQHARPNRRRQRKIRRK